MNERQKVNKIIHTYVDVNKYEDYTDYKGLITALIDWKNKQLTLTDVSQQRELLKVFIEWHNEEFSNYDELPEHIIDMFIKQTFNRG